MAWWQKEKGKKICAEKINKRTKATEAEEVNDGDATWRWEKNMRRREQNQEKSVRWGRMKFSLPEVSLAQEKLQITMVYLGEMELSRDRFWKQASKYLAPKKSFQLSGTNNISQSGRNLHTHICSQDLTCIVQTSQPDWKCKIITGCSQGVCPCVPSHACFHHTAQASAKTHLESPARQQDPKIQGSLVELRPRC